MKTSKIITAAVATPARASHPDWLADEDDGGAAGAEVTFHDEDSGELGAFSYQFAQAHVLIRLDVLGDTAQGGVQVGDEFLGADHEDQVPCPGGVGADLAAAA